MAVDSRLLADIQQAEGCRLTAYKDTKGYWTIGYGHLLVGNTNWAGHTITQAEADAMLTADIDTAATQAATLTEWPSLDTPCRQNAVIELVFNMGLYTWRAFVKARAAMVQKDWQTAHDELLDSDWAIQVGLKRSHRLANYILIGTY